MSRPLPLTPPFLPPTYGVLKSLLENPLKLPLAHDDGEASPGSPDPFPHRSPFQLRNGGPRPDIAGFILILCGPPRR